MPRVAGLVALVLLAALVGTRATNSTYSVAPTVMIRPIFPNSKLILLASNLTVDPDAGRFYLTVDCSYSGQLGTGVLPRATLIGNIAWQQPGLVFFSFAGEGYASCQQLGSSSPPLCPYIQTLVNGPFYFGAIPSTGATLALTLEAGTTYIDPQTNQPFNFLGASIPLAYICDGVCEEFGEFVPPGPLPADANFTNLDATNLQASNLLATEGEIANLSVSSLLLNGQALSISSNVSFTAAPGQISLTYTNVTNLQIGLATYGAPSSCPWPATDTDAFGRSLITCNTPPVSSITANAPLGISGSTTDPVISFLPDQNLSVAQLDSSGNITATNYTNANNGAIIRKRVIYGFADMAVGQSTIIGANNSGVPLVSSRFYTPSNLATTGERPVAGTYIGVQNDDVYATALASSYTNSSVTLAAAVDVSLLRINMLVMTSASPAYSGIITSWNAGGTVIQVSGWYQSPASVVSGVTIVQPGSGYTVGDILIPIAGGSYFQPAQLTVVSVGGLGEITDLAITFGGTYYSQTQYPGYFPLATTFVSLSGGSGSGALVTLTPTTYAGVSTAGQIASGASITFNPQTKVWGTNLNLIYRATGDASAMVGYEMSVINQGTPDSLATRAIWGIDVASLGVNIYANYFARGNMLYGYICGDGTSLSAGSLAGFFFNPRTDTSTGVGIGFYSVQGANYAFAASRPTTGYTFAVTPGQGEIDIGRWNVSGVTAVPKIRFHSSTASTDGVYNVYDALIQGSGGSDGAVGSGRLTYIAADHYFQSYLGSDSFRITSVNNSANYAYVTPSVSGTVVIGAASSTNTNVNVQLRSQGSGTVAMLTGGASAVTCTTASCVFGTYVSGKAGAGVMTSTTGNYWFVSTSVGIPLGVPASIPAGYVTCLYDTTNNRQCCYNAGWKCSAAYT